MTLVDHILPLGLGVRLKVPFSIFFAVSSQFKRCTDGLASGGLSLLLWEDVLSQAF